MFLMIEKQPYSIDTALIQTLGLSTPYLHLEGTRRLEPTSFSDLPVSPWIPAPASKLTPLLEGYEGYVALPVYLKDNPCGDTPIITDFQLAVTGSVAGKETWVQSCAREIREEIGMDTHINSPIKSSKFTHRCRSIYASVYKPTKLTAPNPSTTTPGADDKTRKVVTWILMDKPDAVFVRHRMASTDIAGVMVVVANVTDVCKLLNHFF